MTGLMCRIRLAILTLKGGADMVAVYIALILAGRRTIGQVPATIRADVQAELIVLGLDSLA